MGAEFARATLDRELINSLFAQALASLVTAFVGHPPSVWANRILSADGTAGLGDDGIVFISGSILEVSRIAARCNKSKLHDTQNIRAPNAVEDYTL